MKKLLLIVVLTAACGGSSDSPSLFDVPGDPKADSSAVFGVWAGSITGGSSYADVRVRIAQDSFEAADQCHFQDGSTAISDARASAHVDATTITAIDSASDVHGSGDHLCSIQISPQQIHYSILDGKLTLFELSLDLVKVAN